MSTVSTDARILQLIKAHASVHTAYSMKSKSLCCAAHLLPENFPIAFSIARRRKIRRIRIYTTGRYTSQLRRSVCTWKRAENLKTMASHGCSQCGTKNVQTVEMLRLACSTHKCLREQAPTLIPQLSGKLIHPVYAACT